MKDNKVSIDHINTRSIIAFWLVPLGIVLVGLFIYKAIAGLIILGLALFVALAISPLVNRISRRIPGRSRNFTTALAYIIVVGALSAILAIVVPAVIGETIAASEESIRGFYRPYALTLVKDEPQPADPFADVSFFRGAAE